MTMPRFPGQLLTPYESAFEKIRTKRAVDITDEEIAAVRAQKSWLADRMLICRTSEKNFAEYNRRMSDEEYRAMRFAAIHHPDKRRR